MKTAIILIIAIIIMCFIFWFANNYPDPVYYETYISKWLPSTNRR